MLTSLAISLLTGDSPGLRALSTGGVTCNAILVIVGVIILITSTSLHDAARLTGLVILPPTCHR